MSTSVESPAAAGRWWQVGDAELRTALTDVHTTMRRNYHVVLEIIREADSRGLAGVSGYPNLPVLLADMLRIPRAHATQCVEQARLVIPAESITGVDVARRCHAPDRPWPLVSSVAITSQKGLGYALLDGGTFLSAAHARMLACDCRVVPVVLGSNSEPLDIGRTETQRPPRHAPRTRPTRWRMRVSQL